MPFSPAARRRVEAVADAHIAQLKADYVAKIRRVQAVVEPPLRNSELGAGLDLDRSDIGRIVSEKSRARRTLPDATTRAALDALVAGELLVAVGPPVERRRPVLVCEPPEVARLARTWTVYDIDGRVVAREADTDWETDAVWDLFGDGELPEALTPLPAGPRSVGDFDVSAIGLGCMRLSTQGRPSQADAERVVDAALEAGITFFDSADVYALDEHDLGHNERLLARVAARRGALVATKAGLRRVGNRWIPLGHPKHLLAACDASLVALGVERLDLFQLHVVDRRIPLADSVGALAQLQTQGKVRHVGLCNVDLEQIEAAREVVEIVSVQNAASAFDRKSLVSVAAWCAEQRITFIAHSPLGGWRRKRGPDPILEEVAARHGTTPESVALAWLLGLGEHIVAIPGATKTESVVGSAAAMRLALTADDLALLDGRFTFGPLVRAACAPQPEVVLVMGIPAAGKTRSVAPYLARGYTRLNRDDVGGKLDDLVPLFERKADAGATRFVADNTYPSKASRSTLLAAARRRGWPVRCTWLDVPVAEARKNAAQRMIERCQRLLSPEEMRSASRDDPNLFPPQAQQAWLSRFEPPEVGEGFETVRRIEFERETPADFTNKALVLDYDGTLRRTLSGRVYPTDPDDIEVLPGRTALLKRYLADGYRLLGVSNQSGVATGQLSAETARACFERTNELLGLEIECVFCPHPPSKPPRCWCRKPMPGWGVHFVLKHRLDPAQVTMVGDLDSDRTFAEACGFSYADAEAFFDGRS